jgi:predicted nucleotidyltransferase
LDTDLGELDLLGEIPEGDYRELLPHSEQVTVYGLQCWCLKLEKLIEVKRAAGRPRDFEVIAESEALAEERDTLHRDDDN